MWYFLDFEGVADRGVLKKMLEQGTFFCKTGSAQTPPTPSIKSGGKYPFINRVNYHIIIYNT